MLRSLKKLTRALCLFAYATATLVPTAASAGSAGDPILHIIGADKTAETKRTGTTNQKYASLIKKAAAKHGVPVKIAKAVVQVESNFNPRARGSAGEVGLMQIKPATARGLGYRGSTKALYNPETNLEWGMMYLAGAHKRANGDLCGTILRYNAGHFAKRMNPVSKRYCSKVKRILASS
jgi:soluble lytic murein transglycosylase-like protein